MIPCCGIIILHDSNTILVQSKAGYFSFPKGKREKGENDLETALRETEEETGIKPHQLKLYDGFYVDELSDKGNYNIRYFLADLLVSPKTIEFKFDPTELTNVSWYSFEELFKLDKLKDARKDVFKKVLDFISIPKMDPKDAVKLSKTLAYILRHGIDEHNLSISSDGYVSMKDLMKIDSMKNYTVEQVKYVVDTNSKSRFDIKENKIGMLFIRANQGHSKDVGSKLDNDELLEEIKEPVECVHGTYKKKIGLIEATGLKRMERQHIHFSPLDQMDKLTRQNCNVFVYPDMEAAMKDGIKFYRAKNGVILTEGVAGVLVPKYFKKIEK